MRALTIILQVASVGLLPDTRIRQIYENYNKHNQLKFPSFLHIDGFLWRGLWLPLTSFLGVQHIGKIATPIFDTGKTRPLSVFSFIISHLRDEISRERELGERMSE